MNTLREAVQEYLEIRRGLGFKLLEAGKLLLAFVTFMEQHRASYITSQLALSWAQQPSTVQPAEWARRLSVVRTFARHRSATDPRTQIPAPSSVTIPTEAGATLSVFRGRDPPLTVCRSPDAPSLPVRQAATVDLLLSIWITERFGSTPR